MTKVSALVLIFAFTLSACGEKGADGPISKEAAENTRQTVNDAANKMGDGAAKLKEEAKEKAEIAKRKAVQAAEEAEKAAKIALEKSKEAGHAISDKTKELLD